MELRQEERALDRIRFRLWCSGEDIPADRVKEDLCHFIALAAEPKSIERGLVPMRVAQLTAIMLATAMAQREARSPKDAEAGQPGSIAGIQDDIKLAEPSMLNGLRDTYTAAHVAETAPGRLLRLLEKGNSAVEAAGAKDCELQAAILAYWLEDEMLRQKLPAGPPVGDILGNFIGATISPPPDVGGLYKRGSITELA